MSMHPAMHTWPGPDLGQQGQQVSCWYVRGTRRSDQYAFEYASKQHTTRDLTVSVQVDIPDEMKATVTARRAELVERVAEADETVGELFLMEEPVDAETLRGGIRRATLALKFVPVFMGRSATFHDSSCMS